MSSTDTSDSGMFKMMGFVLIALTIFTLTVMIFARILGADPGDPTDAVMRQALTDRIGPVGQVRTAAMVEAEGAAVAAAPAAEPTELADSGQSGEELYNAGCAACHATGVANAPKFGDEAAWAERSALGLEALVASVINGKGAMPARGGSSYSDGDIERSVKHLTGL